MKMPAFIYGPGNRESATLKDCVTQALRVCRDHERISPPDMREFWFSRALRIVRWCEKRYPEPAPLAPGLPTLSELHLA